MRKLLLIMIVQVVTMAAKGQVAYTFDWRNSNSITAIVRYSKDFSNYYTKSENNKQTSLSVSEIVKYYAYDKKNRKLYVKTADGNYVIFLLEPYASFYKKSGKAPLLKEKEINEAISVVNKELEEHFKVENAIIAKAIEAQKAKEKEDSIRKAREDSIRKVKEDSLEQVRQQEVEEYKSEHKYSHVPVKDGTLYCKFCEKSVSISDEIICLAANRDTIVWMDKLIGDLGVGYYHIHKAAISNDFRNYAPYSYHYSAFRDSLNNKFDGIEPGELEVFNAGSFLDYMKNLKKVAPNGYFDSWSWDSEYSNISFSFTYRNTNAKTIKYIEVFWAALNDVGDVRKTGSFKGTGPVEEWIAATWNWDHSHYYVAGDTSKMRLTKVIITYMNGSKVVIPKAKIMEN